MIEITRDMKIRLLSALQAGVMRLSDFPELEDEKAMITEEFIATLTPEEKQVLLKIARADEKAVIRPNEN